MFNRLFLLAFLTLALFNLYGCNDRQVTPEKNGFMKGESEFVSVLGGQRGGYEDVTSGGKEGRNGEENSSDTTRAIEEGDIVKLVNNYLFVLNQYRGLQIIDLSDIDSPTLISSVPIYGSPVEVYIRDTRAYVVVSNYFSYSWVLLGAADGNNEPFYGSIIRVVDIGDLKNPKIIGGFQIEGDITDTRIVGDVLYAVSNRYSYYYNTRDNQDLTTIFAINIADPKNIFVADRLEFTRSNTSYENNVHVTDDTIYVAQYKWGYYNEYGYYTDGNATDITYVDISDPDGKLKIGARFEVPGVVLNRWQMDYYNGYFRVITPDRYWGNGFPKLYIFKVNSKDDIKHISTLIIQPPRPESLTSVRFDRDRAYAVTYEQKDPLFIIDISDPENPVQKGEVVMSGWLDYIEPRGDVLVALGHDDAGGKMSLAVSMFDVSDMNNPRMIARVNFGEGWGWVPTEINDIHKAFKVLDEINLIIVPFSFYSSENYDYISGIQLIDYFNEENTKGIVKRGLVEHSGWVQRGIPYAADKLLTVSNETVQIVDISNRDKPALTANVELARNSIDFLPVDLDYGLELSTTNLYYWGNLPRGKINLVPLLSPNTTKPYQSIDLGGYFTKLYRVGSNYAVVGYGIDNASNTHKIMIKSFTIHGIPQRDAILRLVDAVEFSGDYSWYRCAAYDYEMRPDRMSGYFNRCYSSATIAQQLPDGSLVFAGLKYDYTNSNDDYHFKYTLIFKQIRIKVDGSIEEGNNFSLELPADSYIGGLVYQNMKAYLTYFVPLDIKGNDLYYAKAYVKIADLSEFNNIIISEGINVPGTVIGSSLSGNYIYTLDYRYSVDKNNNYKSAGYLNTLYLEREKAYLQDSLEIVPYSYNYSYNYLGGYVVKDEKIYFTLYNQSCSSNYERCNSSNYLKTVSLIDPQNISIKSSVVLKTTYVGSMNTISDRLFIASYDYIAGVYVYNLTDPLFPKFESFYRTDGWGSVDNISVIGDKAFISSGPYGVQVLYLK